MEKERVCVWEQGYEFFIYLIKVVIDDVYNIGIKFCIDNFECIVFCNVFYNVESNLLQVELIYCKGILCDYFYLMFCQFYGMSDNFMFNLVVVGFKVGKYLFYGLVWEVVFYLICRVEENFFVIGDMIWEYCFVYEEMKCCRLF